MTPTEILLTALAGLGLFFFGIKMVARNLTAMAGDGLRRHLQRATSRPWRAAVMGVLAGLITQSGRTTCFVMASFAQAGVVRVSPTIAVVVWSNLGCALIIFVTVLPVHLVALLMIGVAGACIAFERPRPLLGAAQAVFGLAVMLFGLKMMSAAAPVLTQLPVFGTVVDSISRSPGYAFGLGLVLTLAAQSHMSIILISVPLAANGVLGFEPSLLLVYGTQAGSAIITWLTGSHFRGEPRQLVLAQVLYNVAGVMFFLLIYVVDATLAPGGLMRGLAGWFGTTAQTQVALAAVVFNVITPLLASLAAPQFARLCARLAPPRGDEDLGRPAFLSDAVRDNPATCLLLAEREQLRLLRRLPEYFAYLRQSERPRTGLAPAEHHVAFVSLTNHIRRFQGQLMGYSLGPAETQWLINQQQRLENLATIEEACHEFCQLALAQPDTGLQDLVSPLAEAIDTFLLTALGAVAEGEIADLEALEQMTANKGPAMEAVRNQYLSSSQELPATARAQLLSITSLFERAAWSLGRFGQLLRAAPPLPTAVSQQMAAAPAVGS